MAAKTFIPLLKCYPVEAGEKVKAWCPFCLAWHVHRKLDISSRRKSHRQARCESTKSPFPKTGYHLQLMTTKERQEIAGSLERGR
jgi:hypothetical protein